MIGALRVKKGMNTHSLIGVNTIIIEGAQWLSGRELDLRPSGRGFKPHRRHCVVSLS